MIGGQEIAVVFIIILILFGPNKIPGAARFLGRIMREVHKAVDEIRREIRQDDDFEG